MKENDSASSEEKVVNIFNSRPLTENGRRLRNSAARKTLNDKMTDRSIEKRRIWGDYHAVSTILKIALNLNSQRAETIEVIKDLQERYANKSSGWSGEMLIKIAVLIDINPSDMLTSKKLEAFDDLVIKKSIESLSQEKLPNFIEKHTEELGMISISRPSGPEVLTKLGIESYKFPDRHEDRISIIKESLRLPSV